jgi:hypothetical protein
VYRTRAAAAVKLVISRRAAHAGDLGVRPQIRTAGGTAIVVKGWVHEYLFREFLGAICQAIGTSLDEYTWQHVWELVDRTDSACPMAGSCLRSSWVVCSLAGVSKARCEFSFEAIATWVLLRVQVPPEAAPIVEAAMLAAQRCRAEPGSVLSRGDS